MQMAEQMEEENESQMQNQFDGTENGTEDGGYQSFPPNGPGGDDGILRGSEDKKIFVGGVSHDTTAEDLVAFFKQFGEVVSAQVKYDPVTSRSRGFAFVEFQSALTVLEVLKQKTREIKGKTVEVKPAKSRENKKIFVGGLPSEFPEEELKAHFERFGKVDDVEWPFDRIRNLRRNFAFVVFEEEAAADAAARENKQHFGDREVLFQCDVKKAVPQSRGRGMGGVGLFGVRGRGGRGRGGLVQPNNFGANLWGNGGGSGAGYGGSWGGGYGAGGWGDWYAAGGYPFAGYGSGYGGYYDGYDYDPSFYYGYGAWPGWAQQAAAAGLGGTGSGGNFEGYEQNNCNGGGTNSNGDRYRPY